MSYDMHFDCGPIEPHGFAGGTFVDGGTTQPWLNITYNYAAWFYQIWPDAGIRALYGKTAAEVVAALDAAIPTLSGVPDRDYWAKTEGNAKAALISLRGLASACPPNAVLNGD